MQKRQAGSISVVTSYDYTLAALCDSAGVDILLVGDSAGMVMLGYDSTIPVSMNEMCMFTGAVSRARRRAVVVSDLPFMSYQASREDAVRNSGRLVKAGADAVKLEGGVKMAPHVKSIVDAGIPVMGHIGLQPQTAVLRDGYRVQGRTAASAERLINDAKSLEDAGAFAIVLEMVACEAAEEITHSVGIPTIGIGSGNSCPGQVLVIQDMLGMYNKKELKFVKRYANLADHITEAVHGYQTDIITKKFPAEENAFRMDDGEYEMLKKGRRNGSGGDLG